MYKLTMAVYEMLDLFSGKSFYVAQSIGDMATSVRNGDIVGNGDINFVTPLS